MHLGRTTLSKFLIQQLQAERKSDLAALLVDIAAAIKAISAMISKGGLADVLGSLETENVQGETQKKMDVISNQVFINTFESGGLIAGMASMPLGLITPACTNAACTGSLRSTK